MASMVTHKHTHSHAGAALELADITISYKRHPVVHHINGTINAGSLLAIAGPNGAGKSTLLQAIVGLKPLAGGGIHLHGASLCDVAYLPQTDQIQRDIPLTLTSFLATAYWPRGHKMPAHLSVSDALAAVGLKGFEKRTLTELSVGQFRRLQFARIMLLNSPLILLDEPFAGVDAETTARLLRVIADWHQIGKTVIAVLHDFNMIKEYFPACLLLARETIAWGKPQDILNTENITRAYSFGGAWNDDAVVCAR